MTDEKEKPYKKEKIPAAVRNAVWNTYMGADKKRGECYVGCGEIISTATMQAGHIKAEAVGGETTIENLRPICAHCNTSMGKTNMVDFIKQYKFNSPLLKEKDFNKALLKDNNQSDLVDVGNKSDYSDTWKSFGWDECIFAVNRLLDMNKINMTVSEFTTVKKCKDFLKSYDRNNDFLRPYFNSFTKAQLLETRSLKTIIDDKLKTKSKSAIVNHLITEFTNKQVYDLNIGVKNDSAHRRCCFM